MAYGAVRGQRESIGRMESSVIAVISRHKTLMMMTAKFLLEMLIDLLATTVVSIIVLNVSYIRRIARRSTVQKYGQLTRKV